MNKKLLFTIIALMALAMPNAKAQGYWNTSSFTAANARTGPASFVIGNYAYMGTGLVNTAVLSATKDFWRFNPDSGTWTQMANFGGAARWGAFSFSIGLYGYIGTGRDASGSSFSDFYRYDVNGNTWLGKSSYPAGGRYGGVGVSCNGLGYAGLGWNGVNYYNDWYEYNPTSDTWTVRTSFAGGSVNYPTGYAIGDKCYVGFGYDGSNFHSTFFKYDPATDKWGYYASFPGKARYGAASLVLGEYAFLTTGSDTAFMFRDCYRIDTTTATWVQMTDFPAKTRFSTAFSIKGKGYIMLGDSLNTLLPNIWQYDTLNVTTKVNTTTWCVGSMLSANIAVNDSLATNNNFELYISDSSGSFQSKTYLGSSATNQSTGIVVQLPNNLPMGNNYRLRTTASSPLVGGLISDQVITIRPLPSTAVTVVGSTSICGGSGSVGFWVDSTAMNYQKNVLTIMYDATKGQTSLSGATKVYIHSGISDTDAIGSSWVNTVGNYGQDDGVGQMDSLGNNMWSISIDVPSFYALGYGYPAKYIGMLFRNEDGSKDGKDSNGNEAYINLQTGAVISSSFNGVTAWYEASYQWQDSGVDISGATHASYTAYTGGDYRVVVSGGFCSDTSSVTTVIAGTSPQVKLTATSTSACLSSQNFTFNDSSTGAVYLRLWDFGDGTFDTSSSISHTYAASGSYNVKLYVFAISGCFTYDSLTVNVESGPAISFFINNSSQCLQGNSFTFADSSTVNSGTVTKWWWSFGDGGTDTLQNTSHTYTTAGNYSVRLKAMSSLGCIDSGSKAATVNPMPVANFGVNAATQCLSGNNFAFADSSSVSTGSISTYNWYFGDGNSSTSQSPTHSYGAVGKDTVALTVTSDQGCSDEKTMVVDILSKPTANVSASGSTTFCQGDSVVFTATPSGLTYQWFMNGSAINGATTDTYIANASGDFKVVVTANGGCGDTSTTKTVTVNAKTAAQISAASSTSFCQGGSVVLNANTGANLSYQWLMNGSNINGATADNYTASASGNYQVVVATNGACSDTSSVIKVTVSTKTTASASPAGATTFCQGGSVALNAVTGSGLTYEWLLNGSTIAGATADNYSATASGDYKVIVNPGGCADTSTAITVTVMPKAHATMSANGATTFCQGGSVTLDASASTNGSTYQWLKNGVPISGSTNSSLVPNASGSYRVIVYPSSGSCEDTSAATVVTINAKATIGAITGLVTAVTNTSKTYSVTNISGATFNWVVTGGTITSGQGTNSIAVHWGAVGAGSVQVNTDCSDTSSKAVTVHVGIMALEIQRLNVYPNPTSNILNIELPQATMGTLSLTDMAGKTIQTWTTQQSNFSMSMAHLPAGVYMLQYSSSAITLRERVVLTK